MARQKAKSEITNFVAGLITEAGRLTFPEGASVDEKNFILNINGSRQRRPGMALKGNLIVAALPEEE